MILNITPEQTKENYLYKKQFQQQSLIEKHDVDILFK